MNNTQDECSCDQSTGTGEIQVYSMDPACCNVEVREINNRNTLEIKKISLNKEGTFKVIHYFEESNIHAVSISIRNILLNHFHPPPDIPILYSHILI